MPQFIPAILAPDEKTFSDRVHVATKFTPPPTLLQIDVVDGVWRAPASWAVPDQIEEIISPFKYELHLMVADPLAALHDFELLAAVRRVIFHIETTDDPERVIKTSRAIGWEVGVALNPETPLVQISALLDRVDEVLFLAVEPGASSQKFQPAVLEKIKELAALPQHPLIAVDGGIDHETAAACIAAGAEQLVVNSALFAAQVSPADAWRFLLK